jgi:hypothetical protein
MTISNDDELRQALEALGDLRLALASLKRDVGRTNPRNFGIMAEGTLDELTRIESEVNEYLGIDDVRAQLWVRVIGTGIDAGDAPTAVMTWTLDSFRKGLQAATEHAYTGKLSTRPTAKVQQAVDIRFAAVAQGSLRIGLNVEPAAQLDLKETEGLAEAASRSLEEYLAVAAWAGDDGKPVGEADAELAKIVPDDGRRRLLLNLVMQLAPRARGAVDGIEFSGRVVEARGPVRLSRKSRKHLEAAVDRIERSVQEKHVGPLRELDLDKHTGTVRIEDGAEVTCEFAEELMTTAQEALGRNVRVVGSRTDSTGRRRTILLVTRLEVLDDSCPEPDDE